MLEVIKEFWKSLEPKVIKAISERTRNCVRRERYDVATPPDGEKIGVKPPYGTEIFLPYTATVINAQTGQAVIVEWRGSLSTGTVVAFGDGVIRQATVEVTVSTAWEGSGPYTQTIAVPGMNQSFAPTFLLTVPESGQADAISAFKSIGAVVAGENSVTVFADNPTTTSINILLKI